MFDGMPDQFFQFLAAAAATTTTTAAPRTLPISFSLHHGSSNFSPNFDIPSYSLSPQPQHPHGFLSPPPNLLGHPQQPQLPPLSLQPKDAEKEQSLRVSPSGFDPVDPSWSNDEVLALLRIRSSMDSSWFPDFTWENVSRKLGELGFKRSAEKCKEKFEEETRSFNSSINNNSNKRNITASNNNYGLFGELEELCNNHHAQDRHHNNQPPPPEEDDRPQPILSEKDQQSLDSNQRADEEETEEEKTGDERERDEEKDEGATGDDKVGGDQHSMDDSEKTEENTKRVTRKRKRQKKFEMFKGFCESIVNKMMAQQEQLHHKVLRDMVRRDEEKIAREEAWKKQEIERIQKEMEVREHEQAISGDRQTKILAFLKKFTASNALECQSLGEAIENLIKVQSAKSHSLNLSQGSFSGEPTSSSCTTTTHDQNQNPSSLVTQNCPNIPTSPPHGNLASSSPNRVGISNLTIPMSSSSTHRARNPKEKDPSRPASTPDHNNFGSGHTSTNATDHVVDLKSPENQANPRPDIGKVNPDDTGRRWPRDEVLALINIRCSLFGNNGDPQHEREISVKGLLWERISQKMTELGYERSAKRCKEKWENINKYFRKTKDLNKKRSVDSRTCPYFHQLSHLYSQGKLVGPPENSPPSTEPEPSIARGGANDTPNGATAALIHGPQGNEGVVQAPSFDFEF